MYILCKYAMKSKQIRIVQHFLVVSESVKYIKQVPIPLLYDDLTK